MPELKKSPSRLLILGSCVSRDILNFSERDDIVLSDYYARSSIASLTAEPVEVDPAQYDRIASNFQRRTVKRDIEKTFLREAIFSLECDAILIDLIDERFDLYEVAPGALITVSGELLQTEILTSKDRLSERWIRSGSERHRELWKEGLRRLFEVLTQRGLVSRVIVNKVYWADCMEEGAPLPGHDAEAIRAANELLDWMYRELENYVPLEQWMKFDALRSNAAHRWGIAPFHYSDAFYQEAAWQLGERIALVQTGAGIALRDGVAAACVQTTPGKLQKFAFFIYKNQELLRSQRYCDKEYMHLDSLDAGHYDIVIFTLTFRPGQAYQATARTTSVLRYSV
jgi:hypothetical protein